MFTLLVIGSVVAFVAGSIIVWQRVQPHRALAPIVPATATVFSLKPGDIVQYTGTDYTVDSTIHYSQDGIGWQAHLLGGGDRDRWLVVEEDDRVVIALVEEIADPGGLPMSATESRPRVTFNGAPYQLRESGRATATRVLPGSGAPQTVTCDYLDYDGPDGQVLYLEFWPPNDREISHGRRINAAALTILPGS
jgi:hypothetical protein